MTYTAVDVVRRASLLADLNAERITYLLFLFQYDIYHIGPIKIAVKYMYAGRPITRLRFYIGHRHIVETELPDSSEWIGLYRLPPPVDDKIFKTWFKHRNKTIQNLRHTIRKKLRLIPIEKQEDYFGVDVDKYFTTEGFKTIKKEI
jgi:hypothetical protein